MKEKSKSTVYSLILCALFAALIAVGAFIKIPVPFVPFTLQLLFTTLAGIVLGPKYGALSVGVYILIGLCGVPIFTQGGAQPHSTFLEGTRQQLALPASPQGEAFLFFLLTGAIKWNKYI